MSEITRRRFIGTLAAGSAVAAVGRGPAVFASDARPALLGGTPVRRERFPSWPVSDDTEVQALTGVLRSGRWNRGEQATTFEREYAELTEIGRASCRERR